MEESQLLDAPDGYTSCVFINCPFDDKYTKLLRPILFVTVYFGYVPRIASERSDSGENRLTKICGLINTCRYSIHDLSRLKSSRSDEFSRMNMPFELGIDFGTRLHGPEYAAHKRFLILEKQLHDFKIALSDLSGVDIKSHSNEPVEVNRAVRDWYYETVGVGDRFPKKHHWPSKVWLRYNEFISFLFEERVANGVSDDAATEDVEKMPMAEFIDSANTWLADKVGVAT